MTIDEVTELWMRKLPKTLKPTVRSASLPTHQGIGGMRKQYAPQRHFVNLDIFFSLGDLSQSKWS